MRRAPTYKGMYSDPIRGCIYIFCHACLVVELKMPGAALFVMSPSLVPYHPAANSELANPKTRKLFHAFGLGFFFGWSQDQLEETLEHNSGKE